MQKQLIIFLLIISSVPSISQEYSWFYLRAKDTLFEPEFERVDEQLIYIGNDIKLKSIFSEYVIYEFKKTFKKAKKENLKKTFFVISDKKELMTVLLNTTPHLFEFGEIIREEDKKIFEPNDYGNTSTIGENVAWQTNLDYYDVMDVPKAWYYTTGSRDITIGISDGSIDSTNIEFKDKTKIFHKSNLARGHGYSVAATAAGQGNNGYGFTGVCYDCSLFGTNYGRVRDLSELIELSEAGADVINCSWGTTKYYQTAQDAIYEMVDNGTIIVAIAHNHKWVKTKNKGELRYYPASYDKVISVATVMHRYEFVLENIKQEENGYYYAENIRGYLGRTMGFKDNDTLSEPFIYPISIRTLNPDVDILGPGVGLVRYGMYEVDKKIGYSTFGSTSGIAPLVSGTVGLMLSLQSCLTFDEVDAILKITAINIDDIKANKPYEGFYGAGMLNTGNAVKMVYDLYSENETATIENQKFSRWDFKLTAYSKEVLIRNQKFTDDAKLNLTAKNRIVIGENTVLKPNANGSVILKIDPTLEKQCELQLREGFPNNKYYYPKLD